MSQTAITLAFEQWKASQAVTGEPVLLDEFVFANVPGLDASKPIDRSEKLPPAAQIVHRQAVSRKGVVNENAVVHSVVLGAEVGDFSFNWIGLINKASNTLAMIVHAPLQQKLKTKDGQQGNVLTRSFLMEYNGAQAETGINTPAETWQIDFTARMAGMDERQRLENIDLYGAAAFLGNGYLVAKSGSQYYVTAGTGYVRGLRAQLAANQNITITAKPVNVWLDVAWTGTLTSAWGVTSKITVAANQADYVQNGVQHYVFAVASIDESGNITDLRPKGTLNEQAASDALKKHEQSRNHPDATTAAKGFTQLSSALDSVSESLAATPKAVKAANDNANGRVPSGRKINGRALTGDINVTAQDIFNGQTVGIGGAADLNTFTIPGLYYQPANAGEQLQQQRAEVSQRVTQAGDWVRQTDQTISETSMARVVKADTEQRELVSRETTVKATDKLTVLGTSTLLAGAIQKVCTGDYSQAVMNRVASIGGNDEMDIAGSQTVTTGKDLIEKIGQIRKSVAAVQQQIIAPVVWIGSGTINVAQLMLDTLDVVKELAEQTASHTHSNTGAPTNAGAIRNTGTKADTLNGKYSPVIGK